MVTEHRIAGQEGGYLPLVNFLVEEGIAVFSWDKPGIGEPW
jgi:alpha-beta hydrolase superfamily lysophospholipase